jgi:hypothetical protein
LGIAIGIVPLALDKEVPQQLHAPLWCLAAALLIAGLATGLEPLRKPIVLGYRLRFGRYPFLFVYLFADMFVEAKRAHMFKMQARFALQEDYVSGVTWSEIHTSKKLTSKLIEAAIDGRLELYGKLVTDRGVFRFLTKIPADHMRTHRIETIVAMQQLSNNFVYTYDPARVDHEHIGAPLRSGCYSDLYVSRHVKMLSRQ